MGFFSDLGNALSSAVSAVGDLVEDVVDAAVDIVEDVVDTVIDTAQDGVQAGMDWVNANTDGAVGDIVGGIVNVVGGSIIGLLEGIQDVAGDVFDILKDQIGIIGSILRLDFAGAMARLGELAIDVVGLIIDLGRFSAGGYVVGGVVNAFKRSSLRDFVDALLQERLGNSPDRLTIARERVGLTGGTFGFRLPGQHRVFRMDSATLPLWDMHNRGVIDLYQLAGLLSFDSFQVQKPRSLVRTVDENGNDNLFPVNRLAISKYVESQGTNGRLRVYAVDRQVVGDTLRTARKKCEKMAVLIDWNDREKLTWFGSNTVHDITREEDYAFSLAGQGQYVSTEKLRPGAISDECTLLALAAFVFAEGTYGQASGRRFRQGPDADGCPTPGRTDQCCAAVDPNEASSVIYRDVWPDYVFRYVLPHEIGHYLGLCHYGHDGFQNIMWKSAESANLSPLSWGLFSYYLESEPHFTLEDARNAWRFMVNHLVCLTGVDAPPQ